MGLAIAVFPYVFSWLTLRRGHSPGSRKVAFGWLAFMLLFPAISDRVTSTASSRNSPSQHDSSSQATAEASPTKKELDQKLFKALHRREDKMEGIVVYSHPSFQNDYSRGSALSAFIITKGNIFGLGFFVTYKGEGWLFVQGYKFLIDGERFEITVPTQRDVGSGGAVYEWSRVVPTDEQEVILRNIAASKDATIRYVGAQFYKDRKISAAEKAALRQVLKAYDSGK